MRVADREWQLKMPVVSEDSRGELRIAIESCEFFLYCFGDYKFGWQLLLIIIVLSIICSDFMLMHLIKYLV